MAPKIKENVAQLIQSDSKGTVILRVQSGNDAGIRTGVMGGCISVIMLYDKSHGENWTKMCGHHGSGGDVAWSKLIDFTITPQVRCVVIAANKNDARVSIVIAEAISRSIVDCVFFESTDAIVFKDGTVRHWREIPPDQYGTLGGSREDHSPAAGLTEAGTTG